MPQFARTVIGLSQDDAFHLSGSVPAWPSSSRRHHYTAVKFQNPNLQKNFDRSCHELSECMAIIPGFSEEDLHVLVLMSMYSTYRMFENGESAGTQEIIVHLLSAGLRAALRSYYRGHSGGEPASFTDFRDRLSDLAGEKFA